MVLATRAFLLLLLLPLAIVPSSLGAEVSSTGTALSPAPTPTPTPLQGSNKQRACIAKAKGRGAGVPVETCPEGKEKNGLLCYKPCRDGYSGRGPVCWKSCPHGTKDLGTVCVKSYGKGCCCTKFGCCHNKCREGYHDDGCTCSITAVKESYGRGAGSAMGCAHGKEEDGALCYDACQQGFSGQGPVCWENATPPGFPFRCNTMLFARDQSTCDQINSSLAKLGGFTAGCIAAGVAVIGAGLAALIPVAQLLCGKTFDSVTNEVQQVLQMTQARTCRPT